MRMHLIYFLLFIILWLGAVVWAYGRTKYFWLKLLLHILILTAYVYLISLPVFHHDALRPLPALLLLWTLAIAFIFRTPKPWLKIFIHAITLAAYTLALLPWWYRGYGSLVSLALLTVAARTHVIYALVLSFLEVLLRKKKKLSIKWHLLSSVVIVISLALTILAFSHNRLVHKRRPVPAKPSMQTIPKAPVRLPGKMDMATILSGPENIQLWTSLPMNRKLKQLPEIARFYQSPANTTKLTQLASSPRLLLAIFNSPVLRTSCLDVLGEYDPAGVFLFVVLSDLKNQVMSNKQDKATIASFQELNHLARTCLQGVQHQQIWISSKKFKNLKATIKEIKVLSETATYPLEITLASDRPWPQFSGQVVVTNQPISDPQTWQYFEKASVNFKTLKNLPTRCKPVRADKIRAHNGLELILVHAAYPDPDEGSPIYWVGVYEKSGTSWELIDHLDSWSLAECFFDVNSDQVPEFIFLQWYNEIMLYQIYPKVKDLAGIRSGT